MATKSSIQHNIKALFLLAAAFLVSSGVVYSVLKTCVLNQGLQHSLRMPRDVSDLRELAVELTAIMKKHEEQVMIAYGVLYIYLQAFAVPGSMWLSVLSGAIFSPWLALFLVCLCSGIGATFCYLLSRYLGRDIIRTYFSSKLEHWRGKVYDERDHLFNFIMFLRIAPICPNWFINIASPHLDVPVWPFFFGTSLGVGPLSYLHVQAGLALHQLSAGAKLTFFNFTTIATIVVTSLLAISPVLHKKYFSDKKNKELSKVV
ncbi:transmembrane protein-like protein 41B [Basidiobolus meristosporus CBS 931.73]|uniref:Transmembrane protein-like protein 41B n=1 Tax=Basidiobolus meristosporus CBS 931.73 TaxID=1314790 RepID=A0A1Y1ZBY3_9FUNG|nr:transmembrane protein-like protein 41B [Basidiobolus meristosporus CBS 931.73]|eukprot:ORY07634.1 transmembrane protein-like protein 41B [Basidiobolus meristosporus CBS 931.73]